MAIRTTCPSCRTVYNLAEHLAGKTVRCKNCEAAIVVRAAKGSAEAAGDEDEPRRSAIAREKTQARSQRRMREDDEDEDEDWERPIHRSNRGLMIGLIAGGAALLLMFVGGAVVVVYLMADRSSPGAPDLRADGGFNKGRRPGPPPQFKMPNFPDDADELPNADPVTRALHQLKSPNAHTRQEGARKLKDALPDERRAEVIKALEPLLNDPDFFTRQFAVEALGIWGNKDAVPILLKAMQDGDTRHEAMKALARLKDERAAEPIAQRLEDLADLLQATEALKQMGPVAEKAVLARLNHPELQVRMMVCEILKTIGTKQSIPTLEKAIAAGKDPFSGENHLVAMQAEQTIKAIKARQ